MMSGGHQLRKSSDFKCLFGRILPEREPSRLAVVGLGEDTTDQVPRPLRILLCCEPGRLALRPLGVNFLSNFFWFSPFMSELTHFMKSLVIAELNAFALGWLITQHAAAAFLSSATPMTTVRSSQIATLLSDGRLLVAGGHTNGGFTSSSAELYDPATGIWTMTSPMNADRAHHTATMLPNGKILVTGGYSSAIGPLSSA